MEWTGFGVGRDRPAVERAHHWDELDAALLALIRLVLDDSWSAEQAAEKMAGQVTDESVLRRLRARVVSALAERPTPLAARAAQTMDALFVGRRSIATLAER